MAQTQKKGSGGAKKHGRDTDKCRKYKDHHIREKHKIVKIARSNGVKWAMEYAHIHKMTDWTKTQLTSLGYSLV